LKSLEQLAEDALLAVDSGYYDLSIDNSFQREIEISNNFGRFTSFGDSIKSANEKAIICEIKFASPSAGEIRQQSDVSMIASEMEAGGASGLSVLTESKNFNGSISNLIEAREKTRLPILMKDIIVSKEQILLARRIGANAILFIEELFSANLAKHGLSLAQAVDFARSLGLDTVAETHTKIGLDAVLEARPDVVGINNRDLNTFETSVDTTIELLGSLPVRQRSLLEGHLIMSESGYETPSDIERVVNALRDEGSTSPNAFLIGTSIMRSNDIRKKVQSFVNAK
jgi:indole-3-glycerol phosphate synthase